MESTVLGVVLDSSVLIGAERAKLKTPEVIKTSRSSIGDLPIVISALTLAELGHAIYRAQTPERSQQRRRFLDELKSQIPIHPVTDAIAEIIARIDGEQAAKGINLPLDDLIIGACALELGYAIGTSNVRDFSRIPGLDIIQL
ncbi:MAG TPA: PIN domain-containing protein [Bryobacteraceae bacterium]|jgi:predicted nucleic acid-binding protein|nr:PIN domain-containing protein [Bryobacteraceae bacterium]